MKKLFLTIGVVSFVVFVLTVVIIQFSIHKVNIELEKAEQFFLSEEKEANIQQKTVYYGMETYYIFWYKYNKEEYITILDKDYSQLTSFLKKDLYPLDILKKHDYQLGYRDNCVVYEIKKRNKTGFVYSYYNALDGEFIKEIKMDK